MRVAKLRQEYAIDVVYRHYPLHPETPATGQTLEALFAGRNIDIPAAKVQMTRLMAEEGLPYGERTMTYNSRLAQELAKWAESQPDDEQIHDALFRAYFIDNQNLADVDNLVTIAEQVRLSASEARTALEERRFSKHVDSDWQRSRQLGVTGVPTFVIANQRLVGAQPYEQLAALVTSAGVPLREQ